MKQWIIITVVDCFLTFISTNKCVGFKPWNQGCRSELTNLVSALMLITVCQIII